MTVDYRSNRLPEDYFCHGCGVTGVKLYYKIFSHYPFNPKCAACSSKDENVVLGEMGHDGGRTNDFGEETFQIGKMIPAIPQEDPLVCHYHQPGHIPTEAWQWWTRLPNNI